MAGWPIARRALQRPAVEQAAGRSRGRNASGRGRATDGSVSTWFARWRNQVGGLPGAIIERRTQPIWQREVRAGPRPDGACPDQGHRHHRCLAKIKSDRHHTARPPSRNRSKARGALDSGASTRTRTLSSQRNRSARSRSDEGAPDAAGGRHRVGARRRPAARTKNEQRIPTVKFFLHMTKTLCLKAWPRVGYAVMSNGGLHTRPRPISAGNARHRAWRHRPERPKAIQLTGR